MKLKYEFEQVEFDGEFMAVPVGDNAENLHAMLRLNDTAAFILECLKEETTEEIVIQKVTNQYEGEKEEITGYVRDYLKQLKENGILE